MNVVSQLATIKNELVRCDDENRRIYQKLNEVSGSIGQQKVEGDKEIGLRFQDVKERIQGVQMELDKIKLMQLELAHKEVARSAREQTMLWLASGGAGAGGTALLIEAVRLFVMN